jgi:hypothetical protein
MDGGIIAIPPSSEPAGKLGNARLRQRAATIVVWAVWTAMTLTTILFVRTYARNIPYMDDFELVSMMTGQQPVSPGWLWAQHNEHRPAVSRLILAGLYRGIGPDFRVGLYFNAGLLSAMAAAMIVLARTLRGRTSVTDIVLPIAILNLGQAEPLLISFALNLILTAGISCGLIALAARARPGAGWTFVVSFGLLLVLLPLCGGSGLVMLPPLVLWLAVYSIWDPWRGPDPAGVARAAGIGLIVVCTIIVGFYMTGYVRPPVHRPPPSLWAAWSTLLEYLSLAVGPSASRYWRYAGYATLMLVTATLARLFFVAIRVPAERSRAFALIAVIASMLITALAVAYSRSFMGRGAGLPGRYVTIAAPLLCVIYVAWLVCGSNRGRRVVHGLLLVLAVLSLPGSVRFGLALGAERRALYLEVERCLRARVANSVLTSKVCPALHPEPKVVATRFRMLEDAGIGPFRHAATDGAASAQREPSAIR